MQIFLLGLFGGFAINALRLVDLSSVPRNERPATFSDPLYVLQFVLLPLLGGILAYVYNSSGTELTPILAVNIGASAPLILKSFASAIPSIGSQKID